MYNSPFSSLTVPSPYHTVVSCREFSLQRPSVNLVSSFIFLLLSPSLSTFIVHLRSFCLQVFQSSRLFSASPTCPTRTNTLLKRKPHPVMIHVSGTPLHEPSHTPVPTRYRYIILCWAVRCRGVARHLSEPSTNCSSSCRSHTDSFLRFSYHQQGAGQEYYQQQQGPPPQGYYPQPGGPPPQGGYYPPQQGYAPPQGANYQQPPPEQRGNNKGSGGQGCLGACLATLCCCFVCEEGCECCAECIECCEMC